MQNLDWNLLRDFLAVAREGSLNRAAATLGVNASTIGRRIEALEAHVGWPLFARSRSGYTLTDEGRDLLDQAEALEGAALALERRVASGGGVRGRVRLATAENLANFLVIPALGALRRAHPELVLEVVTDVRSANLDRHDADLALRLVRPTRGSLTVRRLGRQRYALYGSARLLREGVPPSGRLGEADFIVWSDAYADLDAARWTERALAGRAPALVTTSLYAQYVAARAGCGFAVLPCFLADPDPALRRIPSSADALVQEVWLVMHTDLAASARVRAVADFLVDLVERNADALEGRPS